MRNNQLKINKAMILFVWFVTILFLSQIASASSVDKIDIEDTLNEDLSINEIMTISLVNNTDDQISFTLPTNSYNVMVNDNPKISENDVVNISLNCESCLIKVSYTLNDAVTKSGSESFTFSRTLNFPKQPARIDYSVIMPPGFILGSTDYQSEPSIVPSAKEIKTDGKSIIVVWSEINPELPKRYYLEYYSHESSESTIQELMNEFSELWVWVAIIVSLILGALGGIFGYKKFVPVQNEPYLVPLSLLSPDEKIVLSLLKENKGVMNQKEIGKKLIWSKSKVSAIMTNLQHKEIIAREKFGRNYKVTIVKDIEKYE